MLEIQTFHIKIQGKVDLIDFQETALHFSHPNHHSSTLICLMAISLLCTGFDCTALALSAKT